MAYIEHIVQFGIKAAAPKGKIWGKEAGEWQGDGERLGGNRGSEMGRIQMGMQGEYGRAGEWTEEERAD